MKHYIIAKYNEKVADKAALLPRIREIFSAAASIEGVYGAEVYPCCIERENRYDVMIVIEMEKEALPNYDISEMHHIWKAEFTPLLEKKTIFDHE